MANLHMLVGADEGRALPAVRKIGLADLREALAKGIDDFWAMPTHVIFLSIIYPVAGLVLARLTFSYDVLPLLFPLAAGFTLVGPFAAIGLYELSRRREQGLDASWQHAFDVLRSPSTDGIIALGVLLSAINPKNLALAAGAGIAIAQAALSTTDAAISVAVFVILGSLSIAVPIGYYLFGGESAKTTLDGWKTWLGDHNAAVMTVLLVVIGVVMLGKGVGGL